MTAYLIAEIEVTDPEAYQRYTAMIPPSFDGFNAKFVARGGKVEGLEGEAPKRVIMLAFDSMEEAKRWYDSPLYTAAKLIRQGASLGRLYLVEGV